MEESSGKDWNFPEKYITYFLESLEKNKAERLIGTLLQTHRQIQEGKRSLADFFPSQSTFRSGLAYSDKLLDQGQLDQLDINDVSKNPEAIDMSLDDAMESR